MTGMTKTERKECAATLQQLRERLDALADQRAKAVSDVKALEDDMAAGIDGARAAALNRADDVRAIDMEIAAVERLRSTELARQQADQPFLAAEQKAARRAEGGLLAAEIDAINVKAGDALKTFVDLVGQRGDAWRRLMAGYRDLVGSEPPDIGHILSQVLAGAGMHALMPSAFQVRPGGPVSLAEHDAQVLAPLLPAKNAAVESNRRRQDAINAEYRRQNESALGGEIVPRRS